MATKQRTSASAPHGFQAPRSMSVGELGDSLARLVWESFSDFIAGSDSETPLVDLGIPHDDGVPDSVATEETLIFFMWAHTRGAQLAFQHRISPTLLTGGLDAMHEAVFEDMVENGTPRSHLPIFEHRVALRYTAYNLAADRSDEILGRTAVRHLTGTDARNEPLERLLAEKAIAAARPLTDFLEDVELID